MIEGLTFRAATSADAPAMARCRSSSPSEGPADPRMAAYFDQQHHPHQSLLPRTAFVAMVQDDVIGYIAGHRSTRHGCEGEVQYLFVAPAYRRRGVATALLCRLAHWFSEQQARHVCVCVTADNPAAQPFYDNRHARPLKKFWYAWDDIDVLLR